MSKDWKKFGSPYDPSHSGKMQKPKTAEEKRREEEQEQHMLRGCGDPSCGQCNPETAASFRGGTVTGRFSSPSFSSSMMEEILRSARGRMEFIAMDDRAFSRCIHSRAGFGGWRW